MATTILICASFVVLSVAITSVDSDERCEGATQEQWRVIHADVGGRVELHSEAHRSCKHLYWQRGLTEKDARGGWEEQRKQGDGATFVNGFSREGDLSIHTPAEFRHRSRVNEFGSLDLRDLKPSDTAYYMCICIIGFDRCESSSYHLQVTASFSKPSLTSQRRDDDLTEVTLTCESGGGYPQHPIRWQESSGRTLDWRVINQTEPWQDPDSELWNVNSTIVVNCTQLLNVSCSVGNTTSEYLQICRQPSLLPFPPPVLIAIGVVALLVLGMAVFGFVQLLKRCRGPRRRQPDGEADQSSGESLRTTPELPSSEEETNLSLLAPPR